MRRSTSQFDQPIPLSKTRAYYRAWYAVHDGIHHDDFLEGNKCIYQSKYRRSPFPLPRDVVIEDGEVKEIVNSEFKQFWEQKRDDPNGEDVGVPIQTELERKEITRKLEVIGENIARNNQLMLDVNDQMKSLDDEKDDAIRKRALGHSYGPPATFL